MPAISTHRSVRRGVKQTTGRKRNKKDNPASGSRSIIAPDFLKQQFLPISFNETCSNSNWQQVEQDFFTSVSNLCKMYRIQFTPDTSMPFPMNIASAYQQLKLLLDKLPSTLYLIIAENCGRTTLATVKPIVRNYDLCYVPLNALDNFHKEKNRACFELLLSVYSYLNSCVRMPLLCENDYLTGCYDAISEWVINADNELEENEYNSNCADIKAMYKKIGILEKAVLDHKHLTAFPDRLKSFQPTTANERKFKTVARKLFNLYKQYPNINFYENISCDHLEEDEGERAYPDHYFSFFWDDHAWMHDHLMEYVNCDLQEMAEWEVPVSVQYFNCRQTKHNHVLPFETKLLDLIGELCSVLYCFHHEKHYC